MSTDLNWAAWQISKAAGRPFSLVTTILEQEQVSDRAVMLLGQIMERDKHDRGLALRDERYFCNWCGEYFIVRRFAGRKPKYCCQAHRQAAYKHRQKVREKLGLK